MIFSSSTDFLYQFCRVIIVLDFSQSQILFVVKFGEVDREAETMNVLSTTQRR